MSSATLERNLKAASLGETMPEVTVKYIVISPIRDEAKFIALTAQSTLWTNDPTYGMDYC